MIRRLGLTVVLLLSACAVGPNFHAPPPPATQGYTPGDAPKSTQSTDVVGGEPQRFQYGQDLPGEWWTLFGSTALNELMGQAMVNYPDIAAQQAALRAAQENVRAQAGVFLPSVTGGAFAQRNKTSGGTIAPGFPGFFTNIYTANVNVSYPLDLFGGERRTLEGLQAQAENESFQLEASYLTLTFNVASAAIQFAEDRELLEATRQIIALEEKQLTVIQRLVQLGSETNADVLQQKANLAAVRATLPPLQQLLDISEHQLAILTGRFPHDVPAPELKLIDLKLPQDLPVSLPSALVAQRPDIRAQAAMLHQASAAIGVATANMLPQLTLSGSFGGEALRFASLLEPGSNEWNIAGQITQPLFQGGALRAKRRAALDTYDQATAQYKLTVLSAFQNVADTLTALDNDAQALNAQNDAVAAAKASLDLIQRQYDIGTANYVALLTAQQTYQQARLAYVRALASRYTDTVTLFQALGGGWWNRKDVGALPTHP
ncbi:MAG TPA: efflux transporter outer membrane subunit [Steroidobacteraceae bacterium]|nr:efflux transporter outer membrane subunit [Steroidobacteraceae bacterium]